jgi:hypothetical protein
MTGFMLNNFAGSISGVNDPTSIFLRAKYVNNPKRPQVRYSTLLFLNSGCLAGSFKESRRLKINKIINAQKSEAKGEIMCGGKK